MSLHLVFSPAGLKACSSRWQSGDKFVLLGNGVYAHKQALDAGVEPADLHLLGPDAEARGITSQTTGALVHIDYPALVELTQQCSLIVSWNE
jgi:sulfur relay protein TusB/DsrH